MAPVVLTMNILDLTLQQLRRAASIKDKIDDLNMNSANYSMNRHRIERHQQGPAR